MCPFAISIPHSPIEAGRWRCRILRQQHISIPHSPIEAANADGFARLAKNGSFYLLYFEQDDTPRLLGHAGYPAKMVSAPGTTGEKTSDRKGRTLTFQSVWSGPAPVFGGKVLVGTVEQVLVYLA